MIVTRFGSAADGDLAIDSTQPGLDRRRSAICPHPWTWLRQVHGSRVVTVTSPGQWAGAEADASVTATPGCALAVQTADCAPVLLRSLDDTVVGAAHAGWRGLYDGVLERTVDAMRELGAGEIVAELGPCISAAAYEFGADQLTTLALRFGPGVVAATPDGRPAFDLRAGVRQALADVGVAVVGPEPRCTATDDGFFSWRARSDSARQASVIWIEPSG